MNIPNDTGHPHRLNKFVEYQHAVPPIHPITCGEFAKRRMLDAEACLLLSWLVSSTYSEVTALVMFDTLNWTRPDEYWAANKRRLIFGSARKHAKNMDWFPGLIKEFVAATGSDPSGWLTQLTSTGSPAQNYKEVWKAVRAIPFMGRFSCDLFLEMLVYFSAQGLIQAQLKEPEKLDWRNCDNLTSGLFNILYMDAEADEYDKTGKVAPENLPVLNEAVRNVQAAIKVAYPSQDASLPLVVGKICSFRNLFKGRRYGGYHHDRQLEVLTKTKAAWPELSRTVDELFSIRRSTFVPTLLGEVGGWPGIRKERCRLWLDKGLTGVEEL